MRIWSPHGGLQIRIEKIRQRAPADQPCRWARLRFVMTESPSAARTCALVGPGRAGGAVGIALVEAGWRIVSVAGRSVDAASVRAAADRFGAPSVDITTVGAGASLVVVSTPEAAISDVATSIAPGLEPGALVVHLAGSVGVDALAPVVATRDDVEIGALHPLQTLPSPDAGAARLAGAWAAVAGSPRVHDLATDLGLVPFAIDDADRAAYHAAASVASNHLLALLGQVERIASSAGAPFAAFEPLVRATVDNAFSLGPAAALTGPVARGDVETVARHLGAVEQAEHRAYTALAHAAARLAGRADDPELRDVLA
jgi:predicted short-subunit dehydrogenase-like oxidoreductase (DUF2520 family)